MSMEAGTAVDVPALLAEAGRRIQAVVENEPAGFLAVIEVRTAPASAAPAGDQPPGGDRQAGQGAGGSTEPDEAVLTLVTQAAARSDAWLAFDADQSHFLLLLGVRDPQAVTQSLGDLLHQLAALTVPCDRFRVRPSVGAGVARLTGHVDAAGGVGEIDEALTEAIGLARRSRVERALRVHASAPSRRRRRSGRGAGAANRPGAHFRAHGGDRISRRQALRSRYLKLSARKKAWFLAVCNLMLAWAAPLLVYGAVYLVFGVDVTVVGFWIVLAAVVVTAFTVYAEAVLALGRVEPPVPVLAEYSAASAIVVAYLPNETETILGTLECLLDQDYPGPFEVVLAYNTPRRLPIEDELERLAAGDQRLVLLRVGDSTSKAQNINAALQIVEGEIIGIFDADHRPMPTAFRRAAAWLDSGADVVQGRSVVRNGRSNWLARMVAVEFEGIYAVAHPGRAALHAFGIFGGSNGFWRAEVLDRLRMRPDMLTEDIDISIRAVFEGCRIVVDPHLVSEELAPLTPMGLWSQRIRWSHGWHQVSRRQAGRVWRNQALVLRQRLGASFLLGWRELYPWVAAQMIPILAFSLLVRHHLHVHWLAPLFVVTTVYVSAVGPVQAAFAWRLSAPQLRRRRWWWWQYVLFTGILFGEFKALVNRAAHVRELLGDRAWQVTPRSASAPGGTVARVRADDRVTRLMALGATGTALTALEIDVPLAAAWHSAAIPAPPFLGAAPTPDTAALQNPGPFPAPI